MVAIPVLVRPGLDERHEESPENEEERQTERDRYSRNIYKQEQMEKKAETEGRKWVKSEIVKVVHFKLFLSYHLLIYNMGFCCYCPLKLSLVNLNSPAIFLIFKSLLFSKWTS